MIRKELLACNTINRVVKAPWDGVQRQIVRPGNAIPEGLKLASLNPDPALASNFSSLKI